MPLPIRLGRLQQVERIGVGGFASVWLYHDPELDSDVAVKALADNWSGRLDIRERFLEEARILRRADSDHVVRVYDIGETEGTPWFVMTFADRGTLADRLADHQRLGAPETLDLMDQAGHGLEVLHAQGIIHRDVKPQNLLLHSRTDGSTRLMVADLGFAKAMIHASGLTQVVGTPAYMAPEQAGGVGVDRRADVHALGAVTYQMLTGQLLREGGLADLAQVRMPHAPSKLASVPPEVDDVLLKALHPRPERRWPSASAFTRELRKAMGEVGEPDRTQVRGAIVRAGTSDALPDPVDTPASGNQPTDPGSGPIDHRLDSMWARHFAGHLARPLLWIMLALMLMALAFAASATIVTRFA